MNIAYIDATDGKHTIDNLFKGLKDRGHNVKRIDHFEDSGDLIWVEHLTGNAMEASHKATRPLVLRLSAMELYKQKMESFNWKNVDALVVHGQHLKDYFLERFKLLPAKKIHVIPLCIDTDKFVNHNEPKNARIAMVCEMHWRKQVQMIPDILNALPESYHIYHVGKVVNWDAMNYLEWRLREDKNWSRYQFDGYSNDIVKWLKGQSTFLHLSGTEGMTRAVGEAMSCGLKPVVYEHRGASDQWNGFTFRSMEEMIDRVVGPHEPKVYHELIVDSYSIPVVAEMAETLCIQLTETK